MKPIIFFTFCLAIFVSTSSSAQIIASYGNSDPIVENRYGAVQGSPFQFEQWLPGKIYHIEGEVIEHPLINYNSDNGKMEVRDDNGVITIINEVVYNKVEIYQGNNVYTFENRIRKGDITYYRVIYKGENLAFLEKMDTEIQKGAPTDYSAVRYIGKFHSKMNNYLLKDGQITQMSKSKKKILDFLNSDALNKYVKSEKLSFKKDEDIKKVFEYYEKN